MFKINLCSCPLTPNPKSTNFLFLQIYQISSLEMNRNDSLQAPNQLGNTPETPSNVIDTGVVDKVWGLADVLVFSQSK